MDINTKIAALGDMLKERKWTEAERLLNEIDFSAHYGAGLQDLNWRSFHNLTAMVRNIITVGVRDKVGVIPADYPFITTEIHNG